MYRIFSENLAHPLGRKWGGQTIDSNRGKKIFFKAYKKECKKLKIAAFSIEN